MFLGIFDQAISTVSGIQQLEPQIMTQIFWSQVLNFSAPHMAEPHIVAMRERLHAAVTRALAPLRAYLACYAEHAPAIALDIDAFVKSVESSETMSLQTVLEHIAKAEAQYTSASQTLPAAITIGFARVSTKRVRDLVVDVRLRLLQHLKDLVAQVPRKMMFEATKGFESINRQLKVATTCVEDVAKMRKYIDDLPVKVAELAASMEASQEWYQALEDLRCGPGRARCLIEQRGREVCARPVA